METVLIDINGEETIISGIPLYLKTDGFYGYICPVGFDVFLIVSEDDRVEYYYLEDYKIEYRIGNVKICKK